MTGLYCESNQLTALDVSQNLALKGLTCQYNQLTSLNVSNNKALTYLVCLSNKLQSLNLKNGKNTSFNYFSIGFMNNPDLSCITVDDAAYSTSNWSAAKDATATYKTNCSTLGIEDSVFDKVVLYPNPTKDEVTITNIALEKATVYNTLGQLVKSFTLNSSDTNNTISLSGLPKGIYYVYLINQDKASAKKVIVE
ncbi:MAG: T9SS type A sorting domain-containing protein [Flavobacterium sp.]